VSAIHSSFSNASARKSAGPLTAIQPSFICGRPAILESPLMAKARQPVTLASVPARWGSGAKS
jgi:hypothetical protein